MSPFQSAPGYAYKIRFQLPEGVRPDVTRRSGTFSTGTADKVVAEAVEAMVTGYKRRREWAPLVAVLTGQVTLRTLYDAHELGEVSALLRRLADADLDPLVTEWAQTARSPKYVLQVRRMIPAGERFPASTFTRRRVSAFLASLTVSGSTKNRYRAALSVFARWLVEREVLETNPVRDVRGAKENPPRDRWLSTAQAQALCDAAPPTYRALFALLYGAGVEIGAALRVRGSDLDADERTVHVRGSKTPWRNRVVVLPEWAAKRFYAIRTIGPALVFDGVSYMDAYRTHRTLAGMLKLDGYTLHDARHSYAVNALRSGLRPEVVARQLGHRDATLVHKVYGKYVPDSTDYATTAKARIPSRARKVR